MKPLVSICIPNYNMALFLGAAIESAINQDFDDYEILVVDDCSTDNSLEIANNYHSASGFNYKIERTSRNLGMTENWNYCLDAAKGEFIVLLNADDILHRDFLKVTTGLLKKHKHAGFVGVETIIINERGEHVINHNNFYPGSCLCPQDEEFRILSLGNHYRTSSTLFRKAGITEIGNFWSGLIWCSDWHMWLKFCTKYDAVYVQKNLAYYREHKNNCTSYVYRLNLAVHDLYRMKRKVFDSLPADKHYLKKYESDSIRSLAKLCLRYAFQYIEDSLWHNAYENLCMAHAFDSAIKNTDIYRLLYDCLQEDHNTIIQIWPKIKKQIEDTTFLKSGAPYPYPEGYQSIKL